MSDFTGARAHLERALECLHGTDETSENARQAIDLLIEAVAAKEFQRHSAKIVTFPPSPLKKAEPGRRWWTR